MDKQISAGLISRLLKKRHEIRNDLYVDECTMGSSGSRRLDGWAMSKSWTSPVYTGYEIKVSRSDFLQDEKYDDYFKVCSRFYWVCPTGLIEKSEVGDNCGLIYVTKSGNRLVTKKKAAALIPDKLALGKMMKSILMSRVKICAPTFGKKQYEESNTEYWSKWLEDKNTNRLIGRTVSKELVKRLNDEVLAVQLENTKLTSANYRLQDIKEFLEEIGINPKTGYFSRMSIQQKLGGEERNLIASLKNVANQARNLIEHIQSFDGGNK